MPKCIGDPSRSYKGTEPSPKGLGYCAHTHSVGTTKTGNDGNTWTVETTYRGTKRWVKKSGSGKRKSPKRVSKKKTSGKRRITKRVSKKKTSGKRRTTKRVSKKKTSGKRTSGSRSCIIPGRIRLKNGHKYNQIRIVSMNARGAMDHKHKKIYKNVVYNSSLKEKIEKLICSWTKGKKLELLSVATGSGDAIIYAGW